VKRVGSGSVRAGIARQVIVEAELQYAAILGIDVEREDLVELLGGPAVEWRTRARAVSVPLGATDPIFDKTRLRILVSERLGSANANRLLPAPAQIKLAEKRTSTTDRRWKELPLRRK
jgi:hypothetical protein